MELALSSSSAAALPSATTRTVPSRSLAVQPARPSSPPGGRRTSESRLPGRRRGRASRRSQRAARHAARRALRPRRAAARRGPAPGWRTHRGRGRPHRGARGMSGRGSDPRVRRRGQLVEQLVLAQLARCRRAPRRPGRAQRRATRRRSGSRPRAVRQGWPACCAPALGPERRAWPASVVVCVRAAWRPQRARRRRRSAPAARRGDVAGPRQADRAACAARRAWAMIASELRGERHGDARPAAGQPAERGSSRGVGHAALREDSATAHPARPDPGAPARSG